MNSHRIDTTKNIFKSALNSKNKDEVFLFLQKAKEYILSLEVVNKKNGKMIPIVKSGYRTGFRGFIIDIMSLTDMYTE